MNKQLLSILLLINLSSFNSILKADIALQNFVNKDFKIQKSTYELKIDIATLPRKFAAGYGILFTLGLITSSYLNHSNNLTEKKLCTIAAVGTCLIYGIGKLASYLRFNKESEDTLELKKAQASLHANENIINFLEIEQNKQSFLIESASKLVLESTYAYLALEKELIQSIVALEQTIKICLSIISKTDLKISKEEKTILEKALEASSKILPKAQKYLLSLRLSNEFQSEKQQIINELIQAETLKTIKAQKETAEDQRITAYTQKITAKAQQEAAIATEKAVGNSPYLCCPLPIPPNSSIYHPDFLPSAPPDPTNN